MAKSKGKHQYHKQDANKLNRIALTIGGGLAVIIIIVMIASFVR